MKIEVDAAARGTRLDKFVAEHLSLSRGAAAKYLQDATLNGVPAKPSATLRGGETIELPHFEITQFEALAPEVLAARAAEKAAILGAEATMPPLLFEDDDIMVVNKPRGLVVHAGAGETGATLVDVLRAHGKELSTVGPPERAGIVHRLDKDTTGAMVVCKTNHAHEVLARAFEERRVGKVYTALVCGVPRSPGRIEAPIARHSSNRLKMAVSPAGKAATTLYRVTKSWAKMALCDVDLLTGRTHQIRVHLAYIGHPVAGDELYGGVKRALEVAPEEARKALQVLGGQALHAAKLEFDHPTSGERMRFEAPLTEDFANVLAALDAAE